MSNYVSISSTYLHTRLTDLDSSTNTRLTDLDSNMSNYVSTSSTYLHTRLTDLDSNISYYTINTDNRITHIIDTFSNYASITSDKLTNISSDDIPEGLHNKFIRDGTYHHDLTVNGTLFASNLNIKGNTTLIYTDRYRTENLEIISEAIDGPSLSISQSGPMGPVGPVGAGFNELFTATYNQSNIMIIKSSGNVGIGTSDPTARLDVIGTVKANTFIGNASLLYQVNLQDRSTSMLQEGSNLYFTTSRVADIVNASNNNIKQYIDSRLINASNVFFNSENVAIMIDSSNNIILNQIVETSNNIIKRLRDIGTDLISISYKSLDEIPQGTTNKYIVNNIYDSDLSLSGGLSIVNDATVKALSIMNTVNNSTVFDIKQLGSGNIFNVTKNYVPIFVMRDNGYMGNVAHPEYNIDIEGTVKATNLKGSGNQLYNVNLRDKNTNDLREGCNLYYTDARVQNVLNPVYSNVLQEIDRLRSDVGSITLDSLPQGNNNQYIVNNMYSGALFINGTLTVRDIRIMDIDEIYASNAQPIASGNGGTFGSSNAITVIRQEYDPQINMIRSDINAINDDINNMNNEINTLYDDILEVKETLFDIDLDHIMQGSNNKYIVNDIYNHSLLVNGTLTVRDIRILDVEADYINEIYNSNLYRPHTTGNNTFKLLSEQNVSNIAISLIKSELNSVSLEDIDTLTEYVNITQSTVNSLANKFDGVEAANTEIIDNMVRINNDIATLQQSQYYMNLDHVVQGSKNQYIVDNIYNNSLVVNGTLKVRNIEFIDISNQYSETYTSNLYNPDQSSLTRSIPSTSNVVYDILNAKNYDGKINAVALTLNTDINLLSTRINTVTQNNVQTSNIQTTEITMLKNNINVLTSNLNTALERLARLEELLLP